MGRKEVRVSLCLFVLLGALPALGQQAATNPAAVVPPLVNFSGTLTDINGKPLTSIVGVTFFLYNDQQALSPLWMETQNVTPDRNGRYSVQLGSTSNTGLPAEIFVAGEARWLGVQPQGQAEYPRVMLLSVPYALKAGDAQTIGGLPPSAFLLAPAVSGAPPSTRTAGSAAPSSGPVTGSGTVNFLPLWDGTSDIITSGLFQSGSAPSAMIGINTATPSATVDVATGDVLLEAGNLDLPQTTSATNGVITLGGVPFISSCCSPTSFNTFVGAGAGNFNTLNGSSGDNTAVGYQALTNNNSTTNTAVGSSALKANTTGSSNTAVGTASLQVNTTGGSNTAVGAGALEETSLGLWNTAIGSGAGHSNTTGTNNTFVGQAADAGAQGLTNATAIGSAAIVGESNALVLGAPGVKVGIGTATPAYSLDVQGTGNFTGMVTFAPGQTFPGTGNGTITGVTPGTGLTGGGNTGNVTLNVDQTQVPFLAGNNTFTGNQTVNGNLSATGAVTGNSFQIGSNLFAFGSFGNQNAFLGFAGNTSTTGGYNTASGYQALASNTAGFYNTAVGTWALTNNTGSADGNGAGNTAVGAQALYTNTTGSQNVAVGDQALYSDTASFGNTAIGTDALYSNNGNANGNYGIQNTATGYEALQYNTVGNYNTGMGEVAGSTADRSNVTASGNTFLGAFTTMGTGTLTNATAIGFAAEVDESNALVLGSINGVNHSFASTNVGIGTTKPLYTLDVHGNANFTGLVNFAANQTFPGNGTVSSVGSGAGLTGGPITSTGTLSIATAGVSNAMLVNPSLTVSPGIGLTGGGVVPLGGTTTLSLDTTQVPLLNNANTFTGNQTVNGNLSATGVVTGSAFNIGSNLFAWGSYANNNVFVGFSGNTTTTGQGNTATGFQALSSNATGVDNTASGYQALYSNLANFNAASGFQALYSNTLGYYNAASGSQALYANTTGNSNTASGAVALSANTTGFGNTGDGEGALASNTTGNGNTSTGGTALFNNTTGNYNTGAGADSLVSNTTGSFNTAVGVESGVTGDGLGITGQGDTFLGVYTALGSGAFNNATAVGAYAEAGASNSLVLGSIAGVNNCTASNSCASTNVGIGTIAPAYTLDVHGTGNFTGLVTFASNQTFPGTGNGTITGVTPISGGGLTGGGTTGSVALGLTNSCASGQVLQWSGSAWLCATASAGGTITGVTAGTDLVGGGGTGVVSLGLDTTKVPQLATPNNFAGTQTVAGNLALTGSGNGVQFPDGTLQTTAATSGGAGVPSGFMILGSTSTAPSGYTLSGMTTSGNVAVSLAPMITPRYDMGVTAANGKIYAFGGKPNGSPASNANEVFDPTSNTWTSMAAVRTHGGGSSLLFGAAGFTLGSAPCLMGGHLNTTIPPVATTSVECFNPSSDAWAFLGALDRAGYDMAAVVVPTANGIEFSGDVLSIGGNDGTALNTFLNTIEYYSSGGWATAATKLPTARAQLAAVIDTTANKLYAIGGFNSTSAALSTVEVLDLTTGLWSTAAPLSAPRRGLSAVYLNGKIYAIGGYNGSSIVSTVEVYDPTGNTWTTVPFPGRQLFGAVVLNNLIYLVGGQDGANVLGSTEQYSPPVTLYNFTKN
ncbi:MAG: kelch repeat-containing protein [Candidatus Sulfotelmatobacter sp.]